jgi:hypothetical protein
MDMMRRKSRRRTDKVENNASASIFSLNRVLICMIVLSFILFYEDFKSLIFLDRPSLVHEGIQHGLDSGKYGTRFEIPREPVMQQHGKSISPIILEKPNPDAITEACNDPVWCQIEMPTKSYFKFDPPTDSLRWRQAQVKKLVQISNRKH